MAFTFSKLVSRRGTNATISVWFIIVSVLLCMYN